MPSFSFKSIHQKLLFGAISILTSILLGFLVTVIILNVALVSRQKAQNLETIRKSLQIQGNILVRNNTQAISEMLADNSILSVINLVVRTVKEDSNIVYGIYMDANRRAWVSIDNENQEGGISDLGILTDSISIWAGNANSVTNRFVEGPSGRVFEFVAPVFVTEKKVGTIRYGLSIDKMEHSIQSVSMSSRNVLINSIGVLIAIAGLAIFLTFIAVRTFAIRFTRPIQDLQKVANLISMGDYNSPVKITSNDEIGLLALDFESMRHKIKEYTDKLEEMVAEKTQESRDILNNIEQGLFTVNIDGTVNSKFSSNTTSILMLDDLTNKTIGDVFRLNASLEKDWLEWISMVAEKHSQLSWQKLTRLSPVKELRLVDQNSQEKIILVNYQKMLNVKKKFQKLMILVQDVTEAKRLEKSILIEKELHNNEVKAILGIVHYSEFIPDFLKDMDDRLANLKFALQREAEPTGTSQKEIFAAFSRELHTLKGASATFGFETLSKITAEAEIELKLIKKDNLPMGLKKWDTLLPCLEKISLACSNLRTLVKKIRGIDGEAFATIPVQRIKTLQALSEMLDPFQDPSIDLLQNLKHTCQTIDYIHLSKVTEKYRYMLERTSEKLGKEIEFITQQQQLELSPHVFNKLFEPIIHLLRNAADHGIEPEEIRIDKGKPPTGRIELEFKIVEGDLNVTVIDDGAGIDVERLSLKALSRGLVNASDLRSMSEEEKLSLIFLPGLSTKENISEVSGIGVGMDVVAAWVRSFGGSLKVNSRLGKGTSICLTLPLSKEKKKLLENA